MTMRTRYAIVRGLRQVIRNPKVSVKHKLKVVEYLLQLDPLEGTIPAQKIKRKDKELKELLELAEKVA